MSMPPPSEALARDFVHFAVRCGVLRFGEFKTKAGRLSPYFFNAGLFNDGEKLGRLGEFYARRLLESGMAFDMLFGPAKDHGEGGLLVGAPVAGRVLIIDDVISAGTSVRESVRLLQAAGARPCGVLIALDRQERATEGEKDMEWSAVQYVTRTLQLNVAAIATLNDLLQYLKSTEDPALQVFAQPVQRYRDRYGV